MPKLTPRAEAYTSKRIGSAAAIASVSNASSLARPATSELPTATMATVAATPCTTPGVDNGLCDYGQPAAGTFGNAGVGSERVPSFQSYGASVTKDFTVWHEQKINFRADADNLFNSAYWSNPANNASAATFGAITSVRSGPRALQLSAKYHF